MPKKFIIIIIILILIVVGLIPMITNYVSDFAFDGSGNSSSEAILKRVIQGKTTLFMFAGARKLSEKAIIYFPESSSFDYYLKNAAFCAERDGENEVAIYWYERFLERFPRHKWSPKIKNSLNQLKELN